MSNRLKTSVIIPFYKNREWLSEAVDSVLVQTHPVDEIIVVDDGSEEEIDDLVTKNSSIIIVKQENGGAASARNKGIELSSGDVLFFLDSDDLWLPNKVEKQLEFMNSLKLKWCATYYSTFGKGKSKIIKQRDYRKGLCWRKLYDSCNIQTSTVAIFRDALDKNRFDEVMRRGQDVFLWFKLSNMYPLRILKEPLSLFRVRGTNAHLSISTHIVVRALLWERMTNKGTLEKPRRPLTKLGYIICAHLFKKYKIDKNGYAVKENFITKFLFLVAWSIFRIDLMIQL